MTHSRRQAGVHRKDELFADESHFTEEGHRVAAAIVFQDLRPLLSR